MSRKATARPTTLQTLLAEQLGYDEDQITPDASLVDDLGADSLDIVEIVMTLEAEFKIEIGDEVAESWNHVRDIQVYLERIGAIHA